jgi:hypothetical protein
MFSEYHDLFLSPAAGTCRIRIFVFFGRLVGVAEAYHTADEMYVKPYSDDE